MALELAPHGIRSTIAPTFIETPMTKPFLADPGFALMSWAKIKLGRLGQSRRRDGCAYFPSG